MVTENGQSVLPFQLCQGQSTTLFASGHLTDGHSYVLLLKVFDYGVCVYVCVCVCVCERVCGSGCVHMYVCGFLLMS